jgi:hypothetical protein
MIDYLHAHEFIPLISRQIRVKEEQMQDKLEAGKWGLLVRKMKVVKLMSSSVKKMKEQRIP